MSDPVTNVQIEDVLSSIRRLVSTDDRSTKEQASDPKETPEQASDALVLTPSLRVSGDQKSDHDDETGQGQSSEDAALAQDDDHQDEAELDETAEADDGTAAQDDWSDEDYSDEDDMRDEENAEASSQDHAAADVQAQHDDQNGDENQDDNARIDVFKHHELDDHDASRDWSDDDAHDEDSAEHHPSEDHTADASDATDKAGEKDHEAEKLLARVAGFEEAVAARNDGWEPDGDSDDENAAQPMDALPWQDDTADDDHNDDAEIVSPTEGLDPFVPDEDDFSPDMIEEAVASAATNAFLGRDDPLGDDAAILDEEALRDLVTDIVREELQGALGERITRNVRKLVRREINRALATQELE